MFRTPKKCHISSESIKSCKVCENEINKNKKAIECDMCQKCYHMACIKMSSTKFSSLMSNESLKWACSSCETSIVFTVDNNQKVNNWSKEEMILMFKEASNDLLLTIDRLDKKIVENKEDTDNRIQILNTNVNAEITHLKEEVISIKEMAQTTSSLNIDKIIPQIEKKLKVNDIVVESINRCINPVNSEIDKMNRINNLSNLIIDNIPETKQEDLFQIIYSIGDAINVNIGLYDLNNVFRINSKKKVKSIMVCFQQKRARDCFFDAYFSKIIYLHNIGFTGLKGRIFINEHLTASNSEISRKLRFIKSKNLIKKCYTRNGICYLVHKEDEKPYKIFNEADFQHFLFQNSIICDFDENNNREAVAEDVSQISSLKQGG